MEEAGIIIDISCGGEPEDSLEKSFRLLEEALAEMKNQSQNRKPLLQRVPYVWRDSTTFHMYYAPRVVAIGPLHHDEVKFKLSEKLKIQLAALFIEENGLKKEVVYHMVKGQMEDLKKCYNEEDVKMYNDDELAWIFFVDGCAALHFINCCADENDMRLKELKIKSDQVAFAEQDLFLLENQLPFQLMETIMSCLTDNGSREKMKLSICRFIDKIIRHTRGDIQLVETDLSSLDEQVTHLPALFRKQLLRQPDHDAGSCWFRSFEAAANLLVSRTKDSLQVKNNKSRESLWFSFRNVSELKAAGIYLATKKEGSLEDVSFSSGWFTGTLTLPSIIIDDSTAPKFLNLIAYEMCPDFRNNFEVSSYISFLDTLIDESNDVKLLRDANVPYNRVGSDEEVAKIFNKIGTDVVPNLSTYGHVRNDIQRHYNNKWRTWIAQCLYAHFSSPWTGIAFFAAILALVFSAVQTLCSILSSKDDLKNIFLFLIHQLFRSLNHP